MRMNPYITSAAIAKRFILVLFILPFISPFTSTASTVSETFIFLKEDGRNYLLQRSMRTDNTQYNFYVDKKIKQDNFFYIDPNQYQWDESKADINRLHFDTGSFMVMYPHRFDNEISIDKQGVFTFSSWDGKKQENGHYGMWNTPDNFSRFTYAWLFPDTMEIIDYKSNRKGEWVIRNNMLSFFANDINDVTFTIRYKEKDTDADGVADRLDRCPETAQGITVDKATGCEPDTDADGVIDSLDQCPDSAANAVIDKNGCEIDSDQDSVVDSKDQCPGTPAGAKVNKSGCESDSDQDGVVDSKDQCPDTTAGAKVNASGCEIDSDQDGVVDSKDHCPNSPKCAKVNENGCEIDSDQDGVVDSKDQCPDSPDGAKVNASGCQIDSDQDSVVDSKDQCPDTPAGAQVNKSGCEIDSDQDGVSDSKDQCPDSPDGAKVNASGCQIDSDQDGVVDSKDQCPDSPNGAKVNASGCEIDSDQDGVSDSKDQCPKTPTGTKVNNQGCELDADHDGVADIADLCLGTQADTEVDYTGCKKTAPIVLEGVNFHTESAQLTSESKTILNSVAASLKQHKEIKLEVAGHTDSMGDDAFNLQLSQSRAEAVVKYLVDNGVPGTLLSAKGYGESQPVADNATPAGRAQNRRVELNRMDK